MPAPLIELYIETGIHAGQVHAFAPGQQELTLGRNEPGGRTVDVSFEDIGAGQSLQVSRRHLRLRLAEDGVYALDLSSRNGTEVEGRLLSPHSEVPLRVGARIQLAPPQGPTIMVRERLAQSGWGAVEEEVQLWQERYKALSADYQHLQESHHAMVAKLHGQEAPLASGTDVDWQRCQGKLIDSLERLTFISQLLVDAPVDVKVYGYLQRVVNNLNELRSLLPLKT